MYLDADIDSHSARVACLLAVLIALSRLDLWVCFSCLASALFYTLTCRDSRSIQSNALPILDEETYARVKGYCRKCRIFKTGGIQHCPSCDVCIKGQIYHSEALGLCATQSNYWALCLFHLAYLSGAVYLAFMLCVRHSYF